MKSEVITPHPSSVGKAYHRNRLRRMVRNKWLYIMLLPGLIYFIIFKYIPMYGVLLAFQNYQPFLGFLNSEWVGMKHFDRFLGIHCFGCCLRIRSFWQRIIFSSFSRCRSL